MIFDLNLGYNLVSEHLLLQLLISIITYNRKEHISAFQTKLYIMYIRTCRIYRSIFLSFRKTEPAQFATIHKTFNLHYDQGLIFLL